MHRELREELAIEVRIERPLVTVQHTYSHFRMTLHTFLCRHQRGRPQRLGCADLCWVLPSRLADFAFPKADRVVLATLLNELGAPTAAPRPKSSGAAGPTRKRSV